MKYQILFKYFFIAWVTAAAAVAGVNSGDVFPDPSAHGVVGKLPAVKGKVVLYDFWASWCAPCRAALPGYEKLYQQFHAQGFEVIAIGTDTDAAAAKAFVGKLKLSFPVVADVGQKHVELVAPPTMPTAYLVGRDGKVVSVHEGFHGAKSLKKLEAAIAAALK